MSTTLQEIPAYMSVAEAERYADHKGFKRWPSLSWEGHNTPLTRGNEIITCELSRFATFTL